MVHRHPWARLLWCAAGAALGIVVSLFWVHPTGPPLMLASFGGSTVFLFGLTRADAAQPRAILGGHLGGAAIGIMCYQFLGDAHWVYALALVLTLWYMLLTRTVHPPAGANPVIMVHMHANYGALLSPVCLGVVALMLLAAFWSRLYPGLVRYPVAWTVPSPAQPLWGGWSGERE